MARIRELLERKGNKILTTGPTRTVQQAVQVMNDHRIGALVVVDEDRIIGMFTERDVLRRVVGERRDPIETLVGDVMTTEVVCCRPETTAEEARGAMRDRRIRHLPVATEEGRLVGMVSIGDLNADLQADHEHTLFLLQEYIGGRV
jgi:CBS domain-containing protein